MSMKQIKRNLHTFDKPWKGEARGEEPAVAATNVAHRSLSRCAKFAPRRRVSVEEASNGDAERPTSGTSQGRPPTGRRTQDGRRERNSRRWREWPGRRDRTGRNERRDAIVPMRS